MVTLIVWDEIKAQLDRIEMKLDRLMALPTFNGGLSSKEKVARV